MKRTLALLPMMLAVLTACSFAPAYKVPDTPAAPAQYQELAGWKTAQPMDAADRGAWWSQYRDPQLDALEVQAGNANQNLKAALARLQQARDETRIARADLFPAIDVNAAALRAHTSPNSPQYRSGSPTTGNDFTLAADFSYEVDLWGRVRNQLAAARAGQQASAADLASIDLAIRAELAMAYFNLRSNDARQSLLDKTVDDYRQALVLTQNLYNGGAAALSDVAQAQAQLEGARTQAADVRLQRAQGEHAIAVLLGENPSAYHLPPNPLPPALLPPPIEPGIPSALLERRPDIAEAERRVAAANAQIGVARAAYFPQFSLSAQAGFESTRTSDWLTAPSRFWSLGPQIMMPLFQGGRLLAQTDRAKAAYAEQVANYRNTVLGAYQDVEDNLAALRELETESRTQAAAVDATATVLQQAQYRYDAGIVTYLEVATAETAALQARLSAVTIQARRMSASVLLVKALGGGWAYAGMGS